MKISKTKLRIELRRTIENLKNSGFTNQQCICIISLINSMNMLFLLDENEIKEITENVLNEVFEIEKNISDR